MVQKLGTIVLALLCFPAVACIAVQDRVVESQMRKAQRFLEQEGVALDRVRGSAWTFQFGWYRTMVVIDRDEALVVDPISAEAADALRRRLTAANPDLRVTAVVYSHAHHDHIRGASGLGGLIGADTPIIAHENLARELALEPGTGEVTPPTQRVTGDHTLEWGNTPVELLHLPRSHSDSYLAVYLPRERVLYAPDLVARRGGLVLENDNFLPGVLHAQERLLALDVETIVPGHFELCTPDDLREVHDRLARMREIVAEELAKEPGFDVTQWDAGAFTRIQRRLRDEFGDVPGFNDALVTNTYYLVLGYVGGF